MKDKTERMSNILRVFGEATRYELVEGGKWYAEAWAFCLNRGWEVAAELGQLDRELSDRRWALFAAAVVAVMSPQKEWQVNKALAAANINNVVKGEAVRGHYPAQCAKIEKLFRYFLTAGTVNHNEVMNIISKPDAKKTRNFYLNIIGTSDVATIDGHAANIADNGITRVSIVEAKQPSGKAYDTYAAAYCEVAKALGIPVRELQAVTWVTYRRLGVTV